MKITLYSKFNTITAVIIFALVTTGITLYMLSNFNDTGIALIFVGLSATFFEKFTRKYDNEKDYKKITRITNFTSLALLIIAALFYFYSLEMITSILAISAIMIQFLEKYSRQWKKLECPTTQA